jgi:hypothetical protein
MYKASPRATQSQNQTLDRTRNLSLYTETSVFSFLFPFQRSPRPSPPGYLILGAGAVDGGAKNPTARHLTSSPAPPGIGIAPTAAGEVAVERL